jgi:hypothetical protein
LWRRGAERVIPREAHERALDAVLAQRLERAVRTEALADAAEVELHPGERQPHRVRGAIELDVLPSRARASFIDRTSTRRDARPTRLAPQAREGTERWIEGTVRRARDLERALEAGPQVGAHRARLATRVVLQARELAVDQPVGERPLDDRQALEGRGGRALSLRVAGGPEHDARLDPHADLPILVPPERALRSRRRGARGECKDPCDDDRATHPVRLRRAHRNSSWHLGLLDAGTVCRSGARRQRVDSIAVPR